MSVTDANPSLFDRGLATRREVLGAEHVERSMDGASEFSRPVQELVTEFCWGAVWTRDSLDRRTRSLINLGTLTALGRDHELAVHVRAAVTNGCTVAEIREALLQTTVYCGVPAATNAFRIAERVLRELGELPDGPAGAGTAER
ncbi:carboxymuconolactone decarboxylase family protein [Actinomadura sp. WAC 06369]|uniref:carboxymuconolactone decarboxylase family protein n=1 Tax=Actinomadura sp. WAC 06369 TaxID=2203193 RepID=UPI001F31C626|nr:carboxymuconolactone decarboxylase family protein [Actinomadura sp. WAC 06369]